MPVGADGRNAGGSRSAQGSPGEAVNCCGEFIEEAEGAGVTTYKLEQAISPTETGTVDLPASLLGEEEDENLTAQRMYGNVRTPLGGAGHRRRHRPQRAARSPTTAPIASPPGPSTAATTTRPCSSTPTRTVSSACCCPGYRPPCR